MTIPNILSLFRIFLIPLFLIVYLTQDNQPYFMISALILLVSGITDVLDGYIARKYKMTSELGKILDPLADKMTQIAILAALVIKHPQLLWVVAIYLSKELAMLIGGLIILRKNIPMASSKWFGKMSTVFFFIAIVFSMLSENILILKQTNWFYSFYSIWIAVHLATKFVSLEYFHVVPLYYLNIFNLSTLLHDFFQVIERG